MKKFFISLLLSTFLVGCATPPQGGKVHLSETQRKQGYLSTVSMISFVDVCFNEGFLQNEVRSPWFSKRSYILEVVKGDAYLWGMTQNESLLLSHKLALKEVQNYNESMVKKACGNTFVKMMSL